MGECNAVVIVPVYFINWRNIGNSTLGWSFRIWMFVILGMPLHLTTFIWTMFSKHLVHIQIFEMLVIFRVSFVGVIKFGVIKCFSNSSLHSVKIVAYLKMSTFAKKLFKVFVQPWNCIGGGAEYVRNSPFFLCPPGSQSVSACPVLCIPP